MGWLNELFSLPSSRPNTRHLNSGTLNSSEIDKLVSDLTAVDSEDVKVIREGIFRVIAEGVDEGKRVVIPSFGSFWASRWRARDKQLPDGRKIRIPSRDLPQWTPSRAFKTWMQLPGQEGSYTL